MNGNATVERIRDGFVQASLVAVVVGPLVYLLLPARTREIHENDTKPNQ